ncbi:MAG: carbamoyltransferase HypF [Bacillota bacterium]
MVTTDIKIWGVVQGVGFRPFISRLASFHSLKGWVRNEGGCVHVRVSGDEGVVESFIKDIREKKPGPAEIINIETKVYPDLEEGFDSFQIGSSRDLNQDYVFLPPDLAICDHCRQELFDPTDPRFLHPMISCTQCGPRYSIIDEIPYDRPHTAMKEFPMCPFCEKQYYQIAYRRHHAQTISCHHCGPEPAFFGKCTRGYCLSSRGNQAVDQAISLLNQGEIIAIKGIGGYHFAGTPFRGETVLALRKLKGREAKPFALMFQEIDDIKEYCHVSPHEEKILSSRERPIVLLLRKQTLRKRRGEISEISPEVYGNSQYLGVFLPYTPLHYLLLNKTGPLVMTSANISERPIIKDEGEIMAISDHRLKGVLSHNREIKVRVEDSVVKSLGNEMQFVRRARGYAPLPINLGSDFAKGKSPQVLALGGQLKNTFCLTKGPFAYLSEYMGDLEEQDAFLSFQENIKRLGRLLKIQPELICCDLHPNYLTTKYAKGLSGQPVRVQHHYAHIASVLAEKQIFDQVIGISFDGTGYGTDHKMWGGEFLICSPQDFFRVGHLKYVSLLGGDSSVKEAWKSACCYLYQAGAESLIDDPRWPVIKAALNNGINTIESSSMGRIFDAVSSILGIRHQADYEGQCAIELERKAFDYQSQFPNSTKQAFPFQIEDEKGKLIINYSPCINGILAEKAAGRDIQEISYRFHQTIIESTGEVCLELRARYGINKVALSGGVFQNSILFHGLVTYLKERNFLVFYNTLVPPNDGGISLGQAFIGLNKNRKQW